MPKTSLRSLFALVALVALGLGALLQYQRMSCESPRDVFLEFVSRCAEGKIEQVRENCSAQFWQDFRQKIKFDASQHENVTERELAATHFRTLLPLNDDDLVWRFHGGNYCSVTARNDKLFPEGFLLVRSNGQWKLDGWSEDAAILPTRR